MDLGLSGAKVLVAASRSGLGAATARQLSLEGASVVINGRDLDSLNSTATAIHEESGHPVYAIAADVSHRVQAQGLVVQAAEKLGGLDILITNTGGPPAGTFDTINIEQWDFAYHLLLSSTVLMIKTALPYLRASDRAAILSVTSVTVKQPADNLLLSNTLRAGIAGLIKSLANELGPEGIRVNAILPGWTETGRVAELLEARAKSNNSSPEQERQKRIDNIPLRRIGTPETFANVAVFLCSPAADFVHGAMIPVEGGEIKATF